MPKEKPIFKKENLLYQREEKEGYYTFVSKFHPETMELIINPTGKEILTLCNGVKTLQEIEAEMQKKYPNVPENRIKMDVHKAIANFSRLGIVEWDGENPFLYRKEEPISQDSSLVIGQEEDIIKIETFIEDSKIFQSPYCKQDYFLYKSPLCNVVEYKDVTLRQKLFAYAEDFFLLLQKDRISGLISIAPPFFNYTSAIIKIIISPKDIFTNLIRYAQDNFLFLTVKEVTKIKILELLNQPLDRELKKNLLAEGYKEEGISRDEMGFGADIKVFAREYMREFVEKISKLKARV